MGHSELPNPPMSPVFASELDQYKALARQAEELFDIGHYIFDEVSQRYIYISEGFARIHGTDVASHMASVESLEDDFGPMFPEDRDRVARAYRHYIATGQDLNIVYRVVRPDGEIRWVREQNQARDMAGDQVGITIGVLQDITEQKEIELSLQYKNDQAQQVEAITDIGYCVVDEVAERYLYASDGYAKILGVDVDYLMNEIRSFEQDSQLIHPEDRVSVVEFQDETVMAEMNDQEHWRLEYRIIRPNGEIRWISELGKTVVNESGDDRKSYSVIIDITDQKAAEQAIKQANETLEQKVLERTAELNHANRIKDEFLASMSHELRTPLTSIIGNTELLVERVKDPELKELVESIRIAGNTQLNLVNDILDISKMESGMFTIEAHSFDLSQLLADVKSMLSDRARSAGLDLIFETGVQAHQSVLGDQGRIRQVLINLIGNAIKFTASGQVQVFTRVEGDELRFTVKDSGIGMTPQEQSQLFKKFHQADGSIARQFGGSGLGLYISHGLAKLMGGDLTVTSRKGSGSTFTLAIPFRPGAESVEHTLAETPADSQQFTGSILVVEDTLPVRLVVTRLLESLGTEVSVAENGKEAVDLLERESFDLIFMDMQMPVMDGIEATTIIRYRGIVTPIYALTANVFSDDREKYEKAGCTGFLSKPVVKKELQAVVARHLPDNNE